MRRIHIKVFSLYVAGIIIFLLIRSFAVPPSFGVYEHYRADSVEEIAGLDVKFSTSQSCLACHGDIYNTWKVSHHQDVSCESCHGPSQKHVENPEIYEVMVNESAEFCLLCHKQLPSKPDFMPQIDPATHAPGKSCLSCHNPHVRGGEGE